jgi:hypothetical protein
MVIIYWESHLTQTQYHKSKLLANCCSPAQVFITSTLVARSCVLFQVRFCQGLRLPIVEVDGNFWPRWDFSAYFEMQSSSDMVVQCTTCTSNKAHNCQTFRVRNSNLNTRQHSDSNIMSPRINSL